jgi:DNA-binding XRE family transcriptional regulator
MPPSFYAEYTEKRQADPSRLGKKSRKRRKDWRGGTPYGEERLRYHANFAPAAFRTHFGKIFRTLREKANLSRGEMVRRTGISYSNLQNFEKGESEPRLHDFLVICGALRLTPGQFVKLLEWDFVQLQPHFDERIVG